MYSGGKHENLYIFMHQPRYQAKLKQFRNQIRRTQIQQMKRQLRMGAELDLTTVNDLAAWMGLPQKQYTLTQVLELSEKQLIRPPIGSRMEQGGLSIDAHIRFWRFFSQQLQMDGTLWSQRVASILMEIINKYSYQEVHHNVVYELHLLNTLQVAASHLQSQKEKEELMEWVAGPEGLRVIEACLGNYFLDCLAYSRVYRVIQLGLRSELRQQNQDAAAVLIKILRHADWDNTYQIYQNFYGLSIHLCSKLQRYWKEGDTRTFTDALILLIDSYYDVVKDYTRSGVGYAAALLVNSHSQATRLQGLAILQSVTQFDEGEKMIIEELLESKDIRACHLWPRLFSTHQFCKAGNMRMREVFFSLLENLLANGNESQVNTVCQYFEGEFEDVFDFLAQCFRDQDNPIILRCAINCVKSLAYYGQRQGEENTFLPILEGRGIMNYLEKLSEGDGQVSDIAHQLLECLRRN